MNNNIKTVLTALAFLLFVQPVHARSFELVKSEQSDTIYYVDDDNVRHPFPNISTYRSWYGDDFSKIVTLGGETLSTMPLGKNITIRSGSSLVKVPSWPYVYAVEPGGYLRHITDVGIAENLYGLSWEEKIIDIPEVFFSDYTIGDSIRRDGDVPDGILYKLANEDTLYWKDRNVLLRFSGDDAVRANGLNPNNPFVNSQAFFTREKVIDNFSDKIFDPVREPFQSEQDCRADNLKIGFIYLHKGDLRDSDVEFVQHFKNSFPSFWNEITWGLSSIDTTFPLKIISDTDLFSKRDDESNGFIIKNETLFEFYESSPDTFDDIYIFTNFAIGNGTGASYSPITNAVNGIGKINLDRSSLFGSNGKLKGVISMGNKNLYSKYTKRLEESALERMSHELLHQWSGSLTFKDDTGQINKSLLTEDGVHWNPWATFTSPLGGLGWKDEGGGIFVKDETLKNGFKRQLPEIDLYAMGLLPAQVIENISYLDALSVEPLTDTFSGVEKSVSIEQIISSSGRRTCTVQ